MSSAIIAMPAPADLRRVTRLLASTIVLAAALAGVWIAVEHLDRYWYELLTNLSYEGGARSWPAWLAILLHAGLWAIAARAGGLGLERLARAVWPLLLLHLWWFDGPVPLAGRFWLFYVVCGLLSLAMYRVWRQAPIAGRSLPAWVLWAAMLVLAALFVWWTYRLQMGMYERLLLGWSDFGFFYKRLLNTVRHGAFLKVYSSMPAFFDHFCLGLALLLPVWWVLPGVACLFGTQSIVLGGTGLLLVCLARREGVGAWTSLGLGLLYLLYPTVSQVVFAFSYGFHTNTLALPLLILGLYLLEKRCYRWAWLPMLASVLMKEYIAVYYAGFGFMLIFCGRRRAGATVWIAATTWYLGISQLLIPWIVGDAYRFDSFWQGLGDSPLELLAAPVLQPGLFWGRLFAPRIGYLTLGLLIPVAGLTLAAPRYALAMVPVIVFGALAGNDPFSSIAFHYHTCTVAMVFMGVLAVLAGWERPEWRWPAAGRLLGRLLGDLPPVCRQAWLVAALLTAVLVSTFLSLYPWSKRNLGIIPGATKMARNYQGFRAIQHFVPPDATVTADDRCWAAVVDRRISNHYRIEPVIDTDYHVYQIRQWNDPPSVAIDQANAVLATGLFEVLYYENEVIILKRKVPLPPPPPDLY